MPKPTGLLKENRRDQERNGRCVLDKQTFARNAYIDHPRSLLFRNPKSNTKRHRKTAFSQRRQINCLKIN